MKILEDAAKAVQEAHSKPKKKKDPIQIKPSHKGELHDEMGVPQDQPIPVGKIEAKKAKDEASGNTAGVKQDTFAINAKTKFNK